MNLRSLFIACVLVGHVVFAVGWWWLMPGGFPIGHVRFWLNVVWPILAAALSIFGLAAGLRQRESRSATCVLFFGGVALAATATATLIFPDIKRSVLVFGTAVGLAELTVGFAASPIKLRSAALLLLTATSFGSYVPLAIRSRAPSTEPRNIPCPWEANAKKSPPLRDASASARVSERVTVYPSTGTVAVSFGSLKIEIEPLLTFNSTSASGGLTIFSRQSAQRNSWGPRLTQTFVPSGDESQATQHFLGTRDQLRVADHGAIEITSFAKVAEPTYSHLNTFCVLTISGHQDLQLEFSPCGAERFEVLAADYPVGRPARFATYDAARQFRVVEASSGEKGPFSVLAEGPLEADAPLTLAIIDGGRRAAAVRFDDWSAQASTELSPTAGWGISANAIEFQRTGPGRRDPVMIWITLAGTSVGRGWDTVGHASGIYRNQMVIEVNE